MSRAVALLALAIASLALALWILAASPPAQGAAQGGARIYCLAREAALAHLAALGQARRVTAIQNDGSLVEIFADREGNFTLTVSAPGGLACLVAGGSGFRVHIEGEKA